MPAELMPAVITPPALMGHITLFVKMVGFHKVIFRAQCSILITQSNDCMKQM